MGLKKVLLDFALLTFFFLRLCPRCFLQRKTEGGGVPRRRNSTLGFSIDDTFGPSQSFH